MVITNKRTIHRTGLLAKHSSEVLHTHIRNIRIEQTVVQRLFNVGDISMDSSAGGGANVEINMRGVRDPEGVRDMIDEYRSL
ncbi:MAG: PH domain-containing protein [Phycisphaerales bacterium]|nr:PH domain-containing protein [Phycisphaerales bacterium]